MLIAVERDGLYWTEPHTSEHKNALILTHENMTRAKAERKDVYGRNQLHLATLPPYVDENLEFLIALNVKLDEKDNEGYTALHNAAARNYAMATKRLLEAGADANIVANNGKCALDSAYRHINGNGAAYFIGAHILRMDLLRRNITICNEQYRVPRVFRNWVQPELEELVIYKSILLLEVMQMMQYKVGGSLTLFDIMLTKDLSYRFNQNVMADLKALDCDRYLEFGPVIETKLKADARKILAQSLLSFRRRTDKVTMLDLPMELLEMIFVEMGRPDIDSLISCCDQLFEERWNHQK